MWVLLRNGQINTCGACRSTNLSVGIARQHVHTCINDLSTVLQHPGAQSSAALSVLELLQRAHACICTYLRMSTVCCTKQGTVQEKVHFSVQLVQLFADIWWWPARHKQRSDKTHEHVMKFLFLFLFNLPGHITRVHMKCHALPAAQVCPPMNLLVERSAVTFKHPLLDFISPASRSCLKFLICGALWLLSVLGRHVLSRQRVQLSVT